VRKDPDPVKFNDFAKEYLQRSKANKKRSTYERDLYIMRTLDREFGSKTLQEITTWEIEKFKSARREKLKVASVNRELAVLKHIFSRAVEWGKLKETPARKMKKLKGAIMRVRFLMPDEVQTLLSNCEGIVKEITTGAIHTGMRRGEILHLRRESVDLERGIVTHLDTKNHERRDIPINKTVNAILATRTEGKQGNEYVFKPRIGKRVWASTLQ